MRKTIPKFVITAVAFLALPRVYGVEASHYLHQVAQQGNASVAKDLLDRRVHTSMRNAIETTLMKKNTEEGQEAVIPNNLPNEIIGIISDYTVGLTVHEMTQKVLKQIFEKAAQDGSDEIAGQIANQVTKFAYGLPIEFNIDPSYASRLLIPMAENGHARGVRELLQENADVNARDAFARTALMLAAYEGHTGCVRLLLQANADRNARMPNGLTAVAFAEYAGHEDIVTLIQTWIPPEEDKPDDSVMV